MSSDKKEKIGVLGLGYVGLPLAVEFAKHFDVVGFDIKRQRIQELKAGYDRTGEVEAEALRATRMVLSDDPTTLQTCNVYIITVPTPIDANNQPDLDALKAATVTVGKVLKRNDVVVYESTVYPGCTEEDCVPLLEAESGLKFNSDFSCGFSPERMNPGDKDRTVNKIVKVVSGSTPEALERVAALYGRIITAGVHRAPSLRVAEAAKVIENAQRDINIAFVNELALIFNRLGIDTLDVLQAAATKWNFLPFKPGLVGGHCIGVDPFYLAHKAESVGYHPEVILAGRRINDNMGVYIAGRVMKLMIQRLKRIERPRVLIMGATFKENCVDVRNSRVFDIYDELKQFGCEVDVYDPIANNEEVLEEYGVKLVDPAAVANMDRYQAVIFAVAHKPFYELSIDKKDFPNTILFDIKGIFKTNQVDARL
ncbi:MAG: nucleotide sugar dehydrogenase [Bdellovibrionales bacterium]